MFPQAKYNLRKKIFSFIDHIYEITDEQGQLALYAVQKGFKLKEELYCFADREKTQPLFYIKARNILDFSASYDVFVAGTNEKLGTLRRHGWKSIVADEWDILNVQDVKVGLVKEDSMEMALIRRFLVGLIPQNYDGFIGDNYVIDLKQNFNPFVYKLGIDFSKDTQGLLDRRLGLAMAILLAAIEGKQQEYS